MYKFDISIPEVSGLIDNWIFSERDRAILKRRIIDGIGYEKLAEEFSLSVTQINTIVRKGTEILVKHI